MEPLCKYCNEHENKQEKPALKCLVCEKRVHLHCLKRQGTPGDFAGDVFFDFKCIDCAENGEESFTRNKMPWVNAMLLTIHHLNIQSHGISHRGFFHYKTHIASFIDRNWHQLFGSQVKQKKNWMGTIAGTLSVYNGLLFRSGSYVLGETGWWKLQHNFSPALAAHIIVEMAKDKPKGRPRHVGMDKTLFYSKVRSMGFMDYIVVDDECRKSGEPAPKKPRLSESHSEASVGRRESDLEPRSEPDNLSIDESYACLTARNSFSDVESFFNTYQFDFNSSVAKNEHNDSSSERTTHTGAAPEDSDSGSHAPAEPHSDGDAPAPRGDAPARWRRSEQVKVVKRDSLFSSQLNSVDLPWLAPAPEPPGGLVELTQYEEIQLLKQVEGLMEKVRDPEKKAYLCRLRAKLTLRRLKRHKHLPVFDLDKTVKVLGGYVTEEPKAVADVERVLDRFQRSYLMDSLSGTIPEHRYGVTLLPLVRAAPLRSAYSAAVLKPYIRRDRAARPLWPRLMRELLVATHSLSGTIPEHRYGVTLLPLVRAAPLRSAYSAAVLKPYIRRDRAARPLWPRLMRELLVATHRKEPGYEPPPPASLDYSYVRPQHIPAVNSLCAQFFWPGIDLTEALQHPEFSCVVTYRRLVVGCAFLVPNAGRGETYVSFVLTRPEWRRAGIATFMLYHLLQTCNGKDVTLHVSPTNPAIFLYQKFGFKVEELIQDFYEKYYDIDHKGCRHALFLRLVR